MAAVVTVALLVPLVVAAVVTMTLFVPAVVTMTLFVPAVVMVTTAAPTVITLAHVACCSRSAAPTPIRADPGSAAPMPIRADPGSARSARGALASPTGLDDMAHEALLAGDDQQLAVREVTHPSHFAPGWVEDADARPHISS